jgi:hypothetical protein
VTPGNGHGAGVAPLWRAAGTAEAWERVFTEGVNLGVVFRSGQMRYSDDGDAGPGSVAADIRVAMMAELLGITDWPDEESEGEGTAAVGGAVPPTGCGLPGDQPTASLNTG